ncbi:type II secretion system protein [Patescibacteria group bacterium]
MRKRGFTLVELLVVIGILGVLAALLVANVSSGRSRARDTSRKSDFENIKKALRIYYNDFQQYPADDSSGNILGCVDGVTVCGWGSEFEANGNRYMKELPTDPVNGGSNVYSYIQTNGGEGFELSTYLENNSDEDDGKSQLRCGVIADIANKTEQLYVTCEI